MRVSLNWLKEYVAVPVDPETLAKDMTMLGLEIEAIEYSGKELDQIVVGKILSIEPHPDADKIVVCQTDTGGEAPLQICCGARNMKVGDRVPTAVDGATLPGGFKIGRRKMRGVESHGMMCSAKELGLGEDQEGLLILDEALPVGADVKTALGLDDVVFEIEITPNRGDWAGMIGVARELAAFYDLPMKLPTPELSESEPAASALSSVSLEAPDLCPRYLGRVLTGIKAGPSPRWLAQRLAAAGQRAINNVVDVTNYVLLETGQPLHAFDLNKLAEKRIVVRKALASETIETLDGQKRSLGGADALVIADATTAQCVAGIMGGAQSEVDENATAIFLESAYFLPASVRATSKRLGLSTESSQRFQRGADPEMAVFALDRAAALLQSVAGASIAAGRLEAYPAAIDQGRVTLRYPRTNRFLGIEISPEAQRGYLIRLGFRVIEETQETCVFEVPSWRHDVTMETDLIEEVARLHGYAKIPSTIPRIHPNEETFARSYEAIRRLRRYITSLGLTELYTWTFSNPEDLKKTRLPEAYLNMVNLENPLSENYATMRSTLIPALLNAVAYNLNHGREDIAVFELGPVYTPVPEADLPCETVRLGIAIAGVGESPHWTNTAPRQADFFDLKGLAAAVAEYCEVTLEFVLAQGSTYQAGQQALILHEGRELGCLGKISQNVAKAWEIDTPVYLLELEIETILPLGAKTKPFRPISSFPDARRDLAIVVSKQVTSNKVIETANRSGGKHLVSSHVFDVYEGDQIPADSRSFAIALRFQSHEATLTDKQVQKSVDSIAKALQKDLMARLR